MDPSLIVANVLNGYGAASTSTRTYARGLLRISSFILRELSKPVPYISLGSHQIDGSIAIGTVDAMVAAS